MISHRGKGQRHVEKQAHGGADDWGAQATRSGAQGRGRGARSGGLQAYDVCLEGQVRGHGGE